MEGFLLNDIPASRSSCFRGIEDKLAISQQSASEVALFFNGQRLLIRQGGSVFTGSVNKYESKYQEDP